MNTSTDPTKMNDATPEALHALRVGPLGGMIAWFERHAAPPTLSTEHVLSWTANTDQHDLTTPYPSPDDLQPWVPFEMLWSHAETYEVGDGDYVTDSTEAVYGNKSLRAFFTERTFLSTTRTLTLDVVATLEDWDARATQLRQRVRQTTLFDAGAEERQNEHRE